MSPFIQQSTASQVAHGQLVRLVLAKFSHATVSADYNAPINWIHLHGQGDLIAIFEKSAATGLSAPHIYETLQLKVHQHQQLLEDLDLNSLAREAASQALSRQSGNCRPSTVAVIVKLPCVAIRYPGSIGQIRRFQLKFSSDRDYYTALAMLSEINCPFTESNAGPPLRPALRATSSSQLGLPMFASSDYVPSLSGTAGQLPLRGTSFRTHSSVEKFCEERPAIRGSSISSRGNRAPVIQDRGKVQGKECRRLMTSSEKDTPIGSEEVGHGFQNSNDLNTVLPPKRELPFPRATAKRAQRPSKGAKFPNIVDAGRGTKRNLDSYQQVVAASEAKAPSQEPTDPIETTLPEKILNPSWTNTTPLNIIHTQQPTKGESHDDTTALGSSVSTLPASASNTSLEALQNSIASVLQAYNTIPKENGTMVTQKAVVNHASASAKSIPCADIGSYFHAPDSERAKLIESWICQQLENDEFLQLCVDLEGVWKRIAFGQ